MTTARTAALTALVVLTACAPPLRVRRVPAVELYREESSSALVSSDVSQTTRTVLRRHDLLEQYRAEPEQTIAALRESLVQGTGGQDEIFALAELSLFRAQQQRSTTPHYLAAALYAYAFLFPDDSPDHSTAAPDALDPRTRLACDIYNRALAKALEGGTGEYVSLRAGTFTLPFGAMTVAFGEETLVWHGYRLTDFTPVGEVEITGMQNRYRIAGIGAPLAARPDPLTGVYGADDLVGPNLRVPVTAVLRIPHPRRQLVTSAVDATLEAHATTDEESIRIGDRTVTLEAEPTAVLASTLAAARPWDAELTGFLGVAPDVKPQPTFLRGLQPYARGKIPVVFVHGTASSPFRWANVVNDLLQDPRIRRSYQFWFFTYDSGNPIIYSGYGLRKTLAARVAEFERDGPDPALHQMVVLGHSQGGLLTKLTAVDAGDRFWRNVSSEPFDEVPMSPQTRDMVREMMFVTPLPFVKRVIFLCTPHRGSFLAAPRIVRRLIERLVRLPSDLERVAAEMTGLSSHGPHYVSLERGRIPTSVDNMHPENPFIRTLIDLPIAPGIAANSIIAVSPGKDVEQGGDDGVVEYESAHLAGVESELIVRSDHSAQNPQTVAEVRRILSKHLADVEAESSGVARRRSIGKRR